MTRLSRETQLPHAITIGPGLLEAWPDTDMLFEEDGGSVRDIKDLAQGCTAALAKVGVRIGQRVGLHLSAGPKRFSAFLAIVALGGIAVPLDPAMGQGRLLIASQAAEIDLLLTDNGALPTTLTGKLPVIAFDNLDLLAAPRSLPRAKADRTAVVLFGQGARDTARAVCLSHEALITAAKGFATRYGLSRGRRLHVPLSFNHATRITSELATALAGCTLTNDSAADLAVILDDTPRFTAETAPQNILASGNARRMRSLSRAFPHARIFNCYARAETCGIALSSDPRDPVHTAYTTVGRPLPDVEVMIVDPRTGFDMLLYEVGEIWIRGRGVMTAYDHDPKATAAIRDSAGFFHTGELGYLDSEGRVILADAHAQI